MPACKCFASRVAIRFAYGWASPVPRGRFSFGKHARAWPPPDRVAAILHPARPHATRILATMAAGRAGGGGGARGGLAPGFRDDPHYRCRSGGLCHRRAETRLCLRSDGSVRGGARRWARRLPRHPRRRALRRRCWPGLCPGGVHLARPARHLLYPPVGRLTVAHLPHRGAPPRPGARTGGAGLHHAAALPCVPACRRTIRPATCRTVSSDRPAAARADPRRLA